MCNLFFKKRLLSLFLSLILLVNILSSCNNDNKSYFGDNAYTNTPSPIMIKIETSGKSYSPNDVSLTISYGFFDLNYRNKNNSTVNELTSVYKRGDRNDETVVFAIYACESAYISYVMNDQSFSNFETIDNYTYIKSISESDAFIDEYGYKNSFFGGIKYNHSELITVPGSLFEKDNGSICIKIAAFITPSKETDSYYLTQIKSVEFRYEKKENGLIILR